MKFPLHCLAGVITLTCAASAWSQSSVRIYGILDGSLQSVKPPDGERVTKMNSGSMQTSRLGFSVTEDLGGGLKANVGFLSGINITNGVQGSAAGGAYNLGTNLGLSGKWGAFDLGYLRNPMIFPAFAADKTGYGIPNYGVVNQLQHHSILGTGIGGFFKNSVRYRTPALGGFKAEIAHSNGEQSDTPNAFHDKSFNAFNVFYTSGPLLLSAGATQSKVQTATSSSTIKGELLVAAYKFESFSIGGDWTRSTRPGLDQTSWALTGKIPVPQSSGEFDLAYGRLTETGDKSTYAGSIGYTYHLSKRTALYTYALKMGNNSNGIRGPYYYGVAKVAPGGSTSAFGLGIRHAF